MTKFADVNVTPASVFWFLLDYLEHVMN